MYAVVTNQLREPYDVYFTKISYDITAPGRWQKEAYDKKSIFSHRSMLYTDAGRRPYEMWAHKEFFLIRPVPGRFSISPVICKSLNSYGGSFICDHSITSKLSTTHRYP